MKINHTLYHKGIAYGLLTGTKVPEKPINEGVYSNVNFPDLDLCKPPYSDRCIEGGRGCNCDYLKRQYLKSLLDASIRWEDQEAMRELLPDNAFDRPHRIDTTKPLDGIYPLLGVNAEEVWQYRAKNDVHAEWQTSTHWNKKDWNEYREILRLIPQHNSEQFPKFPNLDHEIDEADFSGKVGVDVKKEPETWICKTGLTTCKSKYSCNCGRVSEEEPTQEELWKNFERVCNVSMDGGRRAFAQNRFHIQKLKP